MITNYYWVCNRGRELQIPFGGDLCGEFTGFNGVLPLYFFLPLSIVLSTALRDQHHCILPVGESSLLSKEHSLWKHFLIGGISCLLHEKSLKTPAILPGSGRYLRLKSNSYAHHMKSQYFGKVIGPAR